MGSPVPPYQITAHDVLEAIKSGAREGTAQALKELFESGDAQVTLAAAADIADRGDRELGEVSVTDPVDISDRAGRKLGEVTVAGAADISDRPGRQLGEVTLSGTTVEIGGTEYRLLPDGNTLVGKASQRPSASAAVTAIGDGVAYFASDTRILSTSDGSDWGELL